MRVPFFFGTPCILFSCIVCARRDLAFPGSYLNTDIDANCVTGHALFNLGAPRNSKRVSNEQEKGFQSNYNQF